MAIRLFESRTLLLKKETTSGTDAVPTGASNAVLSFEGSVSVEADKLERKQDLAYFGADPFVLVGKKAMAEFTIEMIGNSTVGNAAPIAPVLLTCAHAETLTSSTSAVYNPISSGFGTATIYFYQAGYRFKILGAIGTIEWDISIKGYAKGKVKYTGFIVLDTDITETSAPAVTLTAYQTPPAVETETMAVSIGGVTLNGSSLKFNQANDVKIFEGSESRQITVTDRMPTGTVTVFADALATYNPWSVASSLATQAIVVTVNGGAGKIVQLDIGAAQLELPKLTSMDGATMWEIPFNARPTSGNDEYLWTFT